MKTISHNDSNVCIYEVKDDYLRGSFFADKPNVGDRIESTAHCPCGHFYQVDGIISIRDAKISKDCTRNPKGAHYELNVSLQKF